MTIRQLASQDEILVTSHVSFHRFTLQFQGTHRLEFPVPGHRTGIQLPQKRWQSLNNRCLKHDKGGSWWSTNPNGKKLGYSHPQIDGKDEGPLLIQWWWLLFHLFGDDYTLGRVFLNPGDVFFFRNSRMQQCRRQQHLEFTRIFRQVGVIC